MQPLIVKHSSSNPATGGCLLAFNGCVMRLSPAEPPMLHDHLEVMAAGAKRFHLEFAVEGSWNKQSCIFPRFGGFTQLKTTKSPDQPNFSESFCWGDGGAPPPAGDSWTRGSGVRPNRTKGT